MRIALLLPLLLVSAGCAADIAQRTADARPDVCTREYRVGSNIPVAGCAAPKTEEERQRMIDEVKSAVRPNGAAAQAGGSQ